MKIQALTKENFWNDIEARYPKTMERFNEWIDTYKEENNWKELFNECDRVYHKDSKEPWHTSTEAPKYHELPIAMQVGIFFQFTSECTSELSAEEMFQSVKLAIRNDMDNYNLEQILNQ